MTARDTSKSPKGLKRQDFRLIIAASIAAVPLLALARPAAAQPSGLTINTVSPNTPFNLIYSVTGTTWR